MNYYQKIWDLDGYGDRWKKIMGLENIPKHRKIRACLRVWHRMTQ